MAIASHLYVPDAGRNAFTSVTVGVDCRLRKTITWSLRDSFQDREGLFQVERSSQNSPFESVGDPVDGLSLEITENVTLEPDRDTWWRVVLKGSHGDHASDPVHEGFSPTNRMDLQYAHAIYRREYMTLTRYSGVKGAILHKRETGPLCPVCSDEAVGGAPLRSNCPHCDGTGRLGGYYPSKEMYLFIQGAPSTARKSTPQLGIIAPGEKVKARTMVTGWIGTDDVWVSETTGDRYQINDVRPEVIYKDYIITYSLDMERLPFGHTNAINTPGVMDKLPSNEPPPPRRPLVFDDFN